ncbi:glycosyltransferase, partial [bacterium]|nr:glycosyltransferase [bacterium]
VEAMSMKIPSIIMDDSPGLKEHIKQEITGYIAKNEDDLTSKIEFIFNNPIISKQVAKRGSEYVKGKYSLQSMKESYAKFYLEVMDRYYGVK